jgi:hypothetical protein
MITHPNGQIEHAAFHTKISARDEIPGDEFLYRYLLANTPLKAYDDGLPDEEQKALKYFGVKYWQPGMDEVRFKGKTYKVVVSSQ